ncbi:ATP synthase F1 subunit delta [Aequorivita vladivostokensis]|jgi:F-type H+-transporting ATPase subunit delta|uniref:ATP synthase subunit delta n=1 Tax=Aequorivita vladivostokensis TaxID=171194 RepID=A0ABR5DIS4_9FLAO|nr:ATP synthase F1 subunit delta [Aequorivita vladivostokensis]MAB56766.1 ATP synthase F1 subunit delta [Aequorivita sp.]KJJ38693.1 ATP synthase subunit delta [Aequorivita vladivostokensis]MBF30094.1 ATP synthase F1 subunit delta [Aequorivita sp.]HAV55784.1 ATP synthase F1 subunit delta [Aequorivita sp.]HBL80904.1 ATP synthase F1 subunit delta [Aequorivita sp.]|tara:strand:+ start:292565 stop:293101 length:537 start_codon:yes stop_codon:yes gene_type:complete
MSRAAIRYAKAILQKANENNTEAVVFGDMQSVYKTIEDSRELQAVLQSPVIKANDKKDALLKIFNGQSEATHSLINILIANKRASLLGSVAKSYVDIYNDQQGVKAATVITAVPLTPEMETKVLAKVKELTGSDKVTLNSEIDSDIIGGFILRMGDIQYNASIANQLGNLKREFSKSI